MWFIWLGSLVLFIIGRVIGIYSDSEWIVWLAFGFLVVLCDFIKDAVAALIGHQGSIRELYPDQLQRKGQQ